MNDKNVFVQKSKVSYDERCSLMEQRGLVVWLTGLSGSGKSTIAVEVDRMLYEQGIKSFLLDGDNIRLGINSDLGFSDDDRNENIRRISEVAKLFCEAGIVVLAAFISPFAEMRRKAEETIGKERFIEVFVNADFKTCMERDPKGLYKKDIENFTGISSGYEIPQNPDIILDTEKLTVSQAVRLVLAEITKKTRYVK